MITLYGFGPAFGLPDASPFVTKAEVLLKMAGLPYAKDLNGFKKAPKRKLPFIDDDGAVVADSTFIRHYLERRYEMDFDAGLSPAERATAWAFEKMCEDHLYWAIIHARWMIDGNFDAGPRKFFEGVPAPLRTLVIAMVKREVKRNLWGQGFGRHSEDEMNQLAARDLCALAAFLGDKPYLMGARPCGADAAVFAMLLACAPVCFKTPIRTAAELQPNLVAYRDRMLAQHFPECAPATAAAAA
jgi:glutathione S-transferase